jgi:hypothetical protein
MQARVIIYDYLLSAATAALMGGGGAERGGGTCSRRDSAYGATVCSIMSTTNLITSEKSHCRVPPVQSLGPVFVIEPLSKMCFKHGACFVNVRYMVHDIQGTIVRYGCVDIEVDDLECQFKTIISAG